MYVLVQTASSTTLPMAATAFVTGQQADVAVQQQYVQQPVPGTQHVDVYVCHTRYLSIDHSRRRHRQAQGREGISDSVVGAFLVHDEADISTGGWDAEQVRRRYYLTTATTIAGTGRSASLLLLQLIDMIHKSV